jgi:formylglycine-generating enzyme required for sulfatase activity
MSNPQRPNGEAAQPDGEAEGATTGRRYQLTHDYLVPSLREWLTRKRRETMRGRASLLLESQAELWNARPERRYLPSFVEWATISLLTQRSEWTQLERKMMRLATRVHLTRLSLVALLFIAVLLGGLAAKARFDEQRRQRMELVSSLVSELLVAEWERVPEITEKLEPYRDLWHGLLQGVVADPSRPPEQCTRAHLALARHEPGSVPPLLGRLLAESAESSEYRAVFQVLSEYPELVIDAAGRELDAAASGGSEAERDGLMKRRANATMALVRLGHSEELWPLLKSSATPCLRTVLIHRLAPCGVDGKMLLERLKVEEDASIRQAILLALGEYQSDEFAPGDPETLVQRCLSLYRSDPAPAVHAGAEWLLRKWGHREAVEAACAELAGRSVGDWYVTGQLQTMIVLRGPHVLPGWSWQASLEGEGSGTALVDRIDRDFAISAHEVTIEQFRRFRAEFAVAEDVSPDPHCPVNRVTWHEAAQYCRWLSQQEGIPEEQMCYPPVEAIQPGMSFSEDCLSRAGYRLPTQAEWEIGCRAGTRTSRFFGESSEMLPNYAWFDMNSGGHLWPVGTLKPNPFGLFDICGNVMEWCHGPLVQAPGSSPTAPSVPDGPEAISAKLEPVARGGAYRYRAQDADSENRHPFGWTTTASFVGFRIARTIEEQGAPPLQRSGEEPP